MLKEIKAYEITPTVTASIWEAIGGRYGVLIMHYPNSRDADIIGYKEYATLDSCHKYIRKWKQDHKGE